MLLFNIDIWCIVCVKLRCNTEEGAYALSHTDLGMNPRSNLPAR